MKTPSPRIGLFATCLVDFFRPTVGFSVIKLLKNVGVHVEVPLTQTCCGQPAYNNGDRDNAKTLARNVIHAFESFDYIVAPSGSCAGMIVKHYPALFTDDPDFKKRAQALADKTYELISFLTDVLGCIQIDEKFEGSVTYHDSCAALRELKIKDQPRKLLKTISGLTLNEMAHPEVCCGFGGTFCVKYPDISGKMVDDKIQDIQASGAKTVLSTDMGCLLNIAGKLKRAGSAVEVRHVAEVLADMTDHAPAIGNATNTAKQR